MRFLRSLFPCLLVMAISPFAWGQSNSTSDEPILGPMVLIGFDLSKPDSPRLLPVEPVLGPIIPIGDYFESDTDESNPPAPPNEDAIQLAPAHELAPMNRFRHLQAWFGLPLAGPDTDGTSLIGSAIPLHVIAQPAPAPTIEPLGPGNAPVPVPVHPDQIQTTLSVLAAQLASAGLVDESQQIVEFQQRFEREHSLRLLIAFKEAQAKALQAEIVFLKQSQRAIQPAGVFRIVPGEPSEPRNDSTAATTQPLRH